MCDAELDQVGHSWNRKVAESAGSIGPEDLHIRTAQPEDLADLAALETAFGEVAYPYFVLRQLFDLHRQCWLVAAHHTGLLGYVLAVPDLDRNCGWLLGLVVHAGHTGRGYGGCLVAAAMGMLRSRGVRRAYLTVRPSSHAAVAFYRRVGFLVVASHVDYLGPGEDRLIMAKNLGT